MKAKEKVEFPNFDLARRWADSLDLDIEHVGTVEVTTIASWESSTLAVDIIEYEHEYVVGTDIPVVAKTWEVVEFNKRDAEGVWEGERTLCESTTPERPRTFFDAYVKALSK